MIKFYHNGIKTTDFYKLQKARYSYNPDGDHITVYKIETVDSLEFSKEVRSLFNVINNTDRQRNYFEEDYFKIYKDNKYFNQAWDALIKQELKACKNSIRSAMRSKDITLLQQLKKRMELLTQNKL